MEALKASCDNLKNMKPLGYYEFLSPERDTVQIWHTRKLRGMFYFLLFWVGQLEAGDNIVADVGFSRGHQFLQEVAPNCIRALVGASEIWGNEV